MVSFFAILCHNSGKSSNTAIYMSIPKVTILIMAKAKREISPIIRKIRPPIKLDKVRLKTNNLFF